MRRTLFAALMFVLGGPTVGHAQAINGTLLDRATIVPIEGVEVTLRRPGGAELVKARTDSAGKFAIVAPRAGEYSLRLRRIGFEAVSTSLFSLDSGVTITPTLRLLPVPHQLKALRIVAEGMPPFDWTRGFEVRRRAGFGRFLTRQDIEARSVGIATDVLRGMPGLEIKPLSIEDGSAATTYVVTGGRGERRLDPVPCAPGSTRMCNKIELCRSNVYVDGMIVDDIDGVIRPQQMESVEVYGGVHGVPAGFRTNNCGTVIIWTRSTASSRQHRDSVPGKARDSVPPEN